MGSQLPAVRTLACFVEALTLRGEASAGSSKPARQPAKAKRTEDGGGKPKVFCHPAQPLHCAVKEMESWKVNGFGKRRQGVLWFEIAKRASLLIPRHKTGVLVCAVSTTSTTWAIFYPWWQYSESTAAVLTKASMS